MTNAEIVEHVLANFSEYDPADPGDPTAWHFTDAEIRKLILQAIEMLRECSTLAIEELGLSLADAHHQWTPRQRKAWEKADRLLR